MIAGAKLARPMWHVAVLASIAGLVLSIGVVFATLSMAVPIFTGQRARDAAMLAFICVPISQVTLVAVGTLREEAQPRTATKLYALTVVLLAVLLAISPLERLAR